MGCLATEMLLSACDFSGPLEQVGTLNPVVGQAYAGGEPHFLPELWTVLFI